MTCPEHFPRSRRGAKKCRAVRADFGGACGADVSAGMFVSIVTGATTLSKEEWQLSNFMTAGVLGAIASYGGPRCCKRDSYISIIRAAEFARVHLGVEMEIEPGDIKCSHSAQNNQCIGERCPFK